MSNNAMGDIINTIMEVENMQKKDIAAVLDVGDSNISNWKRQFKGVKFNDKLIMLFCWYIKAKDGEMVTDKEIFLQKMKEYQDIDARSYLEKKDNKYLQNITEELNSNLDDYIDSRTVNASNPQERDDSQKEEEEGKSAEDSLNEVGEECFSQEETSEERGDNDQKAREQQFADDNHEEGIGSKNVNIKYDVTTKDLRCLAKEREQEIGDLLDERTKLTVSKNKKMLKKMEKKLQKTIDEEIDILEKLTEYGDSEAMYGLAMIYNSNVYQNANKNDYFKWLLKCAETFDFRSSVKNAKNRKKDFALGALKKCGDYLNNLPEPSVEGEILTAAYDYIDYYIAEKTKYYPSIPIDPPEGKGFSIQPYLGKSANKSVDIKDGIVNKYKEQYDKSWLLFEKKSIHENIRCKRLLNIISEEIKKCSK